MSGNRKMKLLCSIRLYVKISKLTFMFALSLLFRYIVIVLELLFHASPLKACEYLLKPFVEKFRYGVKRVRTQYRVQPSATKA